MTQTCRLHVIQEQYSFNQNTGKPDLSLYGPLEIDPFLFTLIFMIIMTIFCRIIWAQLQHLLHWACMVFGLKGPHMFEEEV